MRNKVYLLGGRSAGVLHEEPPKMVVTAPSRNVAREKASLEDPDRPALWLDPKRSSCEKVPLQHSLVVLKSFQ